MDNEISLRSQHKDIPYKAVDIAKFVFSLGIVVLHSKAHELLPFFFPFLVEKLFLRAAVPFFFVASGYFLASKAAKVESKNDIRKIIIHYVGRLMKPFVIITILNTILEIIKMRLSGYIWGNVLKEVVSHLLFYPYGAMWYVRASITGSMMLLPFLYTKKTGSALLFGGILYLIALLLNNYFFLNAYLGTETFAEKVLAVILSGRNGLFVGFFMLALGMNTYNFSNNHNIKTGLLVIFTVFFYLLYAIEIMGIRGFKAADDGGLYIMHIFFIPCFLFLLTRSSQIKISTEICVFLRKCSSGIYYLHRACLSLIVIIEMGFKLSHNSLAGCLITICCSFAISAIIYLKKKEPFYSLLY